MICTTRSKNRFKNLPEMRKQLGMLLERGEDPPQLRLSISGQPGTGKSECFKAIQWFAYQHGMSDTIGAFSYMWKAALLLQTEHMPAVSTCSFLGINPRG